MAGYWSYDAFEGEAVHRMYREPFVVRGKVANSPFADGEGVTIAAFVTRAEADAFVARGAGHWGAEFVTIENWNE